MHSGSDNAEEFIGCLVAPHSYVDTVTSALGLAGKVTVQDGLIHQTRD